MPLSIRLSTTIGVPREVVFAAFTDFPQSARVFQSATKTEFISPNTTGLGAEWLQFDEENPGPDAPRHTITAFSPPNAYTMTSDDSAAFETMLFRFTDRGAET